jgi:hypothetical protein
VGYFSKIFSFALDFDFYWQRGRVKSASELALAYLLFYLYSLGFVLENAAQFKSRFNSG